MARVRSRKGRRRRGTVYIDEPALLKLARGKPTRALLRAAGEAFADELRAVAPKDSGGGAASINVEDGQTPDGDPAVLVGWDAQHYYLLFPEYGTERQREQRFTRTLLDRYTFD